MNLTKEMVFEHYPVGGLVSMRVRNKSVPCIIELVQVSTIDNSDDVLVNMNLFSLENGHCIGIMDYLKDFECKFSKSSKEFCIRVPEKYQLHANVPYNSRITELNKLDEEVKMLNDKVDKLLMLVTGNVGIR